MLKLLQLMFAWARSLTDAIPSRSFNRRTFVIIASLLADWLAVRLPSFPQLSQLHQLHSQTTGWLVMPQTEHYYLPAATAIQTTLR